MSATPGSAHNDVATNYSYDNLSRLLSVLHQVNGTTIDGASYTMDAAGNRTSKTSSGLVGAEGLDYVYAGGAGCWNYGGDDGRNEQDDAGADDGQHSWGFHTDNKSAG